MPSAVSPGTRTKMCCFEIAVVLELMDCKKSPAAYPASKTTIDPSRDFVNIAILSLSLVRMVDLSGQNRNCKNPDDHPDAQVGVVATFFQNKVL